MAATGSSGSKPIVPLGRAHGRAIDDHPAHWRRSLETGCGIDDVARHDPLATLRTSAESNDGLARRHGRSNGDVEALASESVDGLEDAKRSPDRTLCVVLVRGGCSEDGHDGISDELLDRAAEALDVCLDALVVRPEGRADVLRVGAVGTVREADEIDEQHRDDLPFLSCGNLRRQRLTAGQAEACSFRVLLAAVRTDDHAAGGSGSSSSSREPPLEDAARKHSDEPMVLVDHRDTLRVLGLQKVEGLLEGDVRADREVRGLGDGAELRLLRVEAVRDDLAHERLSRHDADEPLVVGHVDRAHFLSLEKLPGGLRGRISGQLPGIRDHRFSDGAHGKIPRAWSASDTSRIPATSAPVRSDTLRSSAMSHTRSNAFDELLGELGPDLVARPEEPSQVLHPLEVRDRDTTGVRQHVRQDRDPAVGRGSCPPRARSARSLPRRSSALAAEAH